MNPATDLPGSLRRQPNSTNFWLAVLSGSLAVHLLLLLSGRWFLVRMSPAKPGGTATPIELVDVSKTASKPIQTTRSTTLQAVRRSTPQSSSLTSQAQASDSTQPSIVRETAQLPPRKATKPQPFEQRSPLRETVEQPRSQAVPSPIQNSAPTNSALPASSQPQPPMSAPEPLSQPVPSGSPLGEPSTSDRATIDGSQPSSRVPDSSLPNVLVGQERGEGSGVQVALSNSELGNDGKTLPDQPARPIELNKLLPEVRYSSPVELNLRTVVRLRIVVKMTGEVDPNPTTMSVLRGSPSKEYDDFAFDLIKQWRFEPALQAGKPVDSLLDVDVQLNPVR